MITVLGMWERWDEAERTERLLWKATLTAFAVDHWAMCNVRGGPFTSPTQYAELWQMLAAYPGPKTFLVPPRHVEVGSPLIGGGSDKPNCYDLRGYNHRPDAIYVFGNGAENLAQHVTPADDVVSIHTPERADMFAAVAVGMVLYARGKR